MTRLNPLVALAAAAVLALAGCGGGGDDDDAKSGGPVEITMWHGQDDIAGKVLGKLADEFNRTHSDVKVKATTGGVVADQMRQKVTTALASGAYPDIAYIFGSDLANLARSDKVLDLTDDVKKPDFGWDDYYAPAKAATTVNGRVRALPALIDDLAVVYNKKLFKADGRAPSRPRAAGAGTQFIATSKQLTDRGKGTFGTAWPAVGDEDTVWRTWPLVWQAGGDIVDDDGKVAFGGAPGERAFGVVDQLAQDGSVYVDTKPDSDQTYQLFNNDKIGMVVTGPWQLPDFIEAKTDFGVVAAADLRRGADDLGARHVDAVRQRQARARRPPSSSSSGSTRPSRTRSGSRRPARCRCARAPPSSPRGRTTRPRRPACRCSWPGSTARAPSRRSPPIRRSPRRSGRRSSRCCSSAPPRRTR